MVPRTGFREVRKDPNSQEEDVGGVAGQVELKVFRPSGG